MTETSEDPSAEPEPTASVTLGVMDVAQIENREVRNRYFVEHLDAISPLTPEEERVIGEVVPPIELRQPDPAHRNFAYHFDTDEGYHYSDAEDPVVKRTAEAMTRHLNEAVQDIGETDRFDMRHHSFPIEGGGGEDYPGFHRWELYPGSGSKFLGADLPEVGERAQQLIAAIRRQAYILALE